MRRPFFAPVISDVLLPLIRLEQESQIILRFLSIPTDIAEAYRNGKTDAHGKRPERQPASTGTGTPCRHCLRQVPADHPYLVLAHKPFKGSNPYCELGPIFLCAEQCDAAAASFPDAILTAEQYIVRGYSSGERTLYGTGRVVATADIAAYCQQLLTDTNVDFVHIRSASNNCFLCRVERN